MNRWIRHVLIVLQVGGGFMGLSLMVTSLKSAQNMPSHAVIGFSLFACIFLLGIVSGLALVDRLRIGIILSAVYQALQIPIVSSSSATYRLLSGLQIGIQWRESRVGITFDCGAGYFFGWMQGAPFQIGINVLALGLLIYLLTVKPEGKPLGHNDNVLTKVGP